MRPDAVQRLHGMCACAIHDRDTGRVALVRDRFGIKPLYLAQTPGRLAEEVQKDLATYSIGFEAANGERGAEFSFSDMIAAHYGTVHHQIFIPGDEMRTDLPHAIAAQSGPMVSYDNIGFFLLSRAVSKTIEVVQSGQGADEVFGGYHW